jgi:hypothetical protein
VKLTLPLLHIVNAVEVGGKSDGCYVSILVIAESSGSLPLLFSIIKFNSFTLLVLAKLTTIKHHCVLLDILFHVPKFLILIPGSQIAYLEREFLKYFSNLPDRFYYKDLFNAGLSRTEHCRTDGVAM